MTHATPERLLASAQVPLLRETHNDDEGDTNTDDGRRPSEVRTSVRPLSVMVHPLGPPQR
jgi:hypothetical protein